MELNRLKELAGMQLNESKEVDEEVVYKRVQVVLHSVLVKLISDLGGDEKSDVARELLTKAVREYMQDELAY